MHRLSTRNTWPNDTNSCSVSISSAIKIYLGVWITYGYQTRYNQPLQHAYNLQKRLAIWLLHNLGFVPLYMHIQMRSKQEIQSPKGIFSVPRGVGCWLGCWPLSLSTRVRARVKAGGRFIPQLSEKKKKERKEKKRGFQLI